MRHDMRWLSYAQLASARTATVAVDDGLSNERKRLGKHAMRVARSVAGL